MFRILALILAFGTAPTGATAQLTDVSCDDTARLTQTLKQNLGAERHGMGLRDPETLLEIWITKSSGAWMIVQNYTNGTSCIVAMGAHWEALTAEPA